MPLSSSLSPLSSPPTSPLFSAQSRASSQTSVTESATFADKAHSSASSLESDLEDVLVLAHPPEGLRLVQTSSGTKLVPVTRIERSLQFIRNQAAAVSHFVGKLQSSVNRFASQVWRFVAYHLLRLDPVPKKLRPLRDSLAERGYTVDGLQGIMRAAHANLGPLRNRANFAWVTEVLTAQLVFPTRPEATLRSPYLTEREHGEALFKSTLQRLLFLSMNDELCAVSRGWAGWRPRAADLSRLSEGVAALELLTGAQQEAVFCHAPPRISLLVATKFVCALEGSSRLSSFTQAKTRLADFLKYSGENRESWLESLLALSPSERWKFLDPRDASAADRSKLEAAVENQAKQHIDQLTQKVLERIKKKNEPSSEDRPRLDAFLELAQDRHGQWLERLARLDASDCRELLETKPQKVRTLLALEVFVTERNFVKRFDGNFRAFAE